MRPIELRLKNIGPFLDETVNFENLDNMFIITGKTGAGKTFIFDAMTYAIYGALTGNRKGTEKDLRSRYASEDDDCYVEFTFAISDDRFRVKRTVNPHTAFVDKYNIETKEFESVFGKKDGKVTEKNAYLQSLMGLTAAEFSKVILLPQGAFSEFLKQNSTERKETLKKLFPVQDYSRLADLAQKKAAEYNAEIGKLDAIIDGEYKSFPNESFDFEEDQKILTEMENKIQALQKTEDSYTQQLQDIAAKKTDIQHDLEDARINEANAVKLENLESKKNEMSALEEKLKLAEKANTIREFINAKVTAFENYTDSVNNSSSLKKNFDFCEKRVQELMGSESEMNTLKEKVSKYKTELDSLDEKLKKAENYVQLKKSVNVAFLKKNEADHKKAEVEKAISEIKENLKGKNAEELIDDAQKELMSLSEKKNILQSDIEKCSERDILVSEISKLSEEITMLQVQVSEAETLVSKTQKTLDAKKEDVENFRVKNTAYSLINVLKPGCPCPVCGSLEHPVPASIPEGLLNPEEEVQAFEVALNKAKENLNTLCKDISVKESACKTKNESLLKFKDLDKTEVIQKSLDETISAFKSKENELGSYQAVQKRLAELEIDIKELTRICSECDNDYIAVNTSFENLKKDLGEDPETLQDSYDSLKETYDSSKNKYETWKKDLETANLNFSASEAALKEADKNLVNAEIVKKTAENKLLEKIRSSDFTSEKEVKENLMELDEVNLKRKKFNSYKEELRSVKDAVKNARKTKSIKELEEEKRKCETDEETITEEKRKNHENLKFVQEVKITCENSYKKIQENVQKKKELEKEAMPYRKIAANLNGNNPASVQFDVWALGMYFEQVVEFASQRFFEISDHRFEFILRDLADKAGGGKKGLELQILDHNTPNAEVADPAGLSGGETFEASISLALALTDVVQNNSSGIVLDSLFIDEGFGTLDNELLDQTMDILSELSESKMIGFISHVESLQDSESGISSQINVIKTDNGSHIEIV